MRPCTSPGVKPPAWLGAELRQVEQNSWVFVAVVFVLFAEFSASLLILMVSGVSVVVIHDALVWVKS